MTSTPNPITPSPVEEPVAQQNLPPSSLKGILLKNPFLGWFMKTGYLQGAFWATMICLVSVFNDVLMRFLGQRLHVAEIVFFRFLFSMVTVIPLMMSRGLTLFKTDYPHFHIFRAILGVGAFVACCYAVNVMPLSENTTIMFSQPLFFLPLAVLFLREKVDMPRWIATIFGFAGLLIIIQPGAETFQLVTLVPMAAALQFALLDVLAKKMVVTENTYSMLFYFAFGTTILAFIPALLYWQTPTLLELGWLILLGIGANLIQVCVIRAFSATDASALMPFRYVEFIFSALFGFLLFGEIPMSFILEGAAVIIAATFFISYYEARKKKKTA